MVYPSLDDIKNLRGDANVIPVCKSVLADTETPVSVWMKLYRNAMHSFLLESADGDGTTGRYSFIGANPYMTFTANGQSWEVRGEREDKGGTDPAGALRKLLADRKQADFKDMPRFHGGAVGYFSYDSVRIAEDIPDKNPKDTGVDDIFFGFYRDLIAFDNKKHRILFISNIFWDNGMDIDTQYQKAVSRIDDMMRGMEAQIASPRVPVNSSGNITSNFDKKLFEEAVDKCKEYIKAGDIFQVVLSQRFKIDVDADPFNLYRVLRTVNPSPYMFYLSLDKTHVIGASPEMLVRVGNGIIENRPIAGTRRRGESLQEDERLIHDLINDPKETAEHIMLVDLGRNDVGRVSEYGSVRVDNLMQIEKYSHVIHIVTDLSGKLKKGRDALDALFSCFPAGTLSGAPKIRAMEIIDELEPTRRGLYGGALGYIDFSGNMDMCIVIRTIIYKNGAATIQAGAGIVADSVPAREYQETLEKASALFAAIKEAGKVVGD
ncbi:MAG: anthranilate synthase component I [Chitinispirillia bacterium]|nr:anthranilate synthase component I [Chitinispirillia bacterium]MCL2267820.1 anthranilate synthase component I [Chitinispirillia bacterium]